MTGVDNLIIVGNEVSPAKVAKVDAEVVNAYHRYTSGDRTETLGIENRFGIGLRNSKITFAELRNRSDLLKSRNRIDGFLWDDRPVYESYLEVRSLFGPLSEMKVGVQGLAHSESYGTVTSQFRAFTLLQVADLLGLYLGKQDKVWGSTALLECVLDASSAGSIANAFASSKDHAIVMNRIGGDPNHMVAPHSNFYTLSENASKLYNLVVEQVTKVAVTSVGDFTEYQHLLGIYRAYLRRWSKLIQPFVTVKQQPVRKEAGKEIINVWKHIIPKKRPFVKIEADTLF
jgi:hypothetical protein